MTSIMHLHSFRLGYVNQHFRPLLYDKDVVLPQNVKSGRHVSIRKDCGRERTSHFEPGYRDAEPQGWVWGLAIYEERWVEVRPLKLRDVPSHC